MRLCGVATLSVLAATLAGCVPSWPSADWAGSKGLSTTETLRFVVDADCNTPWPFNPVAGDYFHEVSAVRPVPGQQWLYEIQYRDATTLRNDTVYVSQWWTSAKTYAAPLPSYDARRKCVVLVHVPRAADAPRPYFVEDAHNKERTYREAHALERSLVWIWCAVFILLLIPSWLGFPCSFGFEARAGAWFVAASAAVLIIVGILVAGHVFIEQPWQEFQSALAYETWFDALPRDAGGLLPISRGAFAYLLAGPPAPASTYIRDLPVSVISSALGGAWLGCVVRAARDGVYWWLVPLPLEQAHERALAEGRAPTVEELDAALYRALAGKKEWQINVLRCKAERFARRLQQFIRVSAPPMGT